MFHNAVVKRVEWAEKHFSLSAILVIHEMESGKFMVSVAADESRRRVPAQFLECAANSFEEADRLADCLLSQAKEELSDELRWL